MITIRKFMDAVQLKRKKLIKTPNFNIYDYERTHGADVVNVRNCLDFFNIADATMELVVSGYASI